MLEVILCVKFFSRQKIPYFFISLLGSLYFGYKLNLTFPLKKCPECYGVEVCSLFENKLVQLSSFSYILTIFNSRLTKSVYYGIVNQSTAVVLKKKYARVSESFDFSLLSNVSQENTLTSDNVQTVVFCPGFTHLDFLFKQIKGDVTKKRLWLDTRISIEPLLLLLLEKYNWPIPKYYGACGDVIFEDYRGEPLLKFISSSIETRALLAVELLKMAQLFTFGHPDFIFYFTDYSLHNLVVDYKGKVTLVDLDNVIIFNKSSIKDYSVKNTIHISTNYDYNKYAFSPLDICSHYLSDHNYFSICKYLLIHSDEGLLRDISQELNSHRLILELLNECSNLKKGDSRISAGQELQMQLKMLIESKHWKFNN